MANDLGKMRIFRSQKDDSEYVNALNRRIAKLEYFESNLASQNIRSEFSKSINLTKECNQIAESLKSAYINLAKILPVETEKALDQVIAFQIKAANTGADSKIIFPKQMMEYALASQKEDYKIAKQVLLEAITSKSNNNQTMLEFVDSKFPEDDSFERVSLRMTIAILMTNYQQYMSLISTCIEHIKLAQTFRDLFYIGIVGIHEDEMNKKDFNKRAEGLFSLPLLSNVVNLVKMIKDVINTVNSLQDTELPEIIKEAQELDLFLSKYQTSLKMWKSTAKSQLAQFDTLRNNVEQYQ